MGPLFGSQMAAETRLGRLGRGVGPPVGEGLVGGMATHIDDQPFACSPKQGEHRLADLEDRRHVELQQPLPLVKGHLGEGPGIGRTGVVDQNRGDQAATQQLCQARGNGSGISQIYARDLHPPIPLPQAGGQGFQFGAGRSLRRRTGEQQQVEAGGGEGFGSGRPNTAGRARNQNSSQGFRAEIEATLGAA